MKKYDVVVVGAGSGGLTAAVGFKNIGKSVLLIEREHMGGECTNTGCIPSKTLLHRATHYSNAIALSGENEQTKQYKTETLNHVRKIIGNILEHETPEKFEKEGIDVVFGEAIYTSPSTLRVGKIDYEFGKSVIATGSSPRMIDIPGLDSEHVLTNQNVFLLEKIPEKLLIIGSGPIGMELGQAFAMLGTSVTIVTRDKRFAALEDPKISELLEKRFEDQNIQIIVDSEVTSVSKNAAHISSQGKKVSVDFDKVLIAIGRVPNIPEGLKSAGVQITSHGVETDKHHRTTNKNIFAVGDVALQFKFTHTADDAARHVVKRSLLKVFPLSSQQSRAIPKVTYTRPSIATVGLSYTDAVKKYGEHKIIRVEASYEQNDRAITDGATEYGHAIVVAKKISGRIVGAHIIGQSSGEIISLFTLAIEDRISMWRLNKLIYPYPTISLIIKKLTDNFMSYQLSNIPSDIFSYFK